MNSSRGAGAGCAVIRRELRGSPFDPFDEVSVGRHLALAPVLGRRVDAGRDHGRPQVHEQRTDRVLDRERVTGRAAGRRDQDGLGAERVAIDDVEELLEEAVVRAAEDRRDRDDPVAVTTASSAAWSNGEGKPVSIWLARSMACARSSMTSSRGSRPASRRWRSVAAASRSPSSRLDDGSDRPAVTTTSVRVAAALSAGTAASDRGRPRPPRRRREDGAAARPARPPDGAPRTPGAGPARPRSQGCPSARGRS